jgi:hypothetical protein
MDRRSGPSHRRRRVPGLRGACYLSRRWSLGSQVEGSDRRCQWTRREAIAAGGVLLKFHLLGDPKIARRVGPVYCQWVARLDGLGHGTGLGDTDCDADADAGYY